MATVPGGIIDTSSTVVSASVVGALNDSLTTLLGADTASFLTGNSTVSSGVVTVSGGTEQLIGTLATLVGGGNTTVTTVAGGGTLFFGTNNSTVVGGTGADTVFSGGSSVLLGNATSPVTATFDSGGMTLQISLPANISTAVEGLTTPVTGTQAQSYLHAQLDAVLPAASTDTAAQSLRTQLLNYIDAYTQYANSTGQQVKVKIVTFADTTGSNAPRAASDINFTAENSSSTTDVFTFLMSDIQAGKTLVINNVEKAIAVGNGNITVGDSTSTDIRGDHMAQQITGGSGNDTLVGGGGNDTLVGGGGADTFGFNGLGNYVVTDFNVATDKLAFDVSGIHSFTDLAPLVTKLEARGSDTYVEFAHGAASITLVGVSPAQITAEMIKFTI